MAKLVYFNGTMDSGKSTLALQTHFNYSNCGRRGLVFTCNDRGGQGRISSRIGLEAPAIDVTPETDFFALVADAQEQGNVDYLICDEAQFYTPEQVEQLAHIVDDLGIDVFAFGILTDFRRQLFPGSQRLIELADHTETLQVPARCWCGRKATHNARTMAGEMVLTGEQVVVGDTDGGGQDPAQVGYQVLCRKHHMRAEPRPRGES